MQFFLYNCYITLTNYNSCCQFFSGLPAHAKLNKIILWSFQWIKWTFWSAECLWILMSVMHRYAKAQWAVESAYICMTLIDIHHLRSTQNGGGGCLNECGWCIRGVFRVQGFPLHRPNWRVIYCRAVLFCVFPKSNHFNFSLISSFKTATYFLKARYCNFVPKVSLNRNKSITRNQILSTVWMCVLANIDNTLREYEKDVIMGWGGGWGPRRLKWRTAVCIGYVLPYESIYSSSD